MAAEREVIYRIRVEPDPKAAAETKKFASDIGKSFEKDVAKASKDAMKSASAETREAARIAKLEAAAAAKAISKAFSDSAKGIEREERAAAKAIAAAFKQLGSDVRRETKDMERVIEQSAQKRLAANNMVAESFERTLSGSLKLGRAITLLGQSGDKDVQALVDALVRFQIVADSITGTVAIVRGLAQAWQGVRASVTAATAAQAAYNVLGASGGGRAAGGAATGIVGGAAGGAAAAKGSAVLAGGGAATAGAGIAAAVGGFLGGRAIFETLTGRDTRAGSQSFAIGSFYARQAERFGLINRGTSAAQAAQARFDANTLQRGAIDEQIRSAGSVASQRRGLDFERAKQLGLGRQFAGQELSAAKAGLATAAPGAQQDVARDRYTEALERQKSVLEDQKRIVEDKGRLAIDAANKELDKLRQQRDERKAALADIKKETASAQERFAQLNPVEQQRVVDLAKKAAGGATLSREEASTLAPFRELENVEGQLQKSFEALAGPLFKQLLTITGQAAAQAQAEAKVQAVEATINIKTQIAAKLELDAKNEAAQIANQIRPLIDDLIQQRTDAIEAELRRQENEQQVRAAQQRRASAGA